MKLYAFEVRHATEADASDILRITKEAFEQYSSELGREVEALTETESDVLRDIASREVYVAYIDDVPVGSVRVKKVNETTAYLSRFGVKAEYRGNGIGKILMNTVSGSMRAQGIRRIELHTASKFFALIRFYYGRGFYVEEVSTDRGYIRAKLVKEL